MADEIRAQQHAFEMTLHQAVSSMKEQFAQQPAAKMPAPPPQSEETQSDSIEFVKYDPHGNNGQMTIDRQYDVNSNRGRDFQRFLSN